MADRELHCAFRARIITCASVAALVVDISACAGEGDNAGSAAGGPQAGSGGKQGCDYAGIGGLASTEPCLAFGTPVRVGQAEEPALVTLSGLVASRIQPGVLFAHGDDSGPTFFAIDKAGHTLEGFRLAGAFATNLEDIALGPGPDSCSWLYLGDIGDNAARDGTGRTQRNGEIRVYRLPEPTVSLSPTGSVTVVSVWEELRYTYPPDRAHDAETLMVDPTTGDLLIVTREADESAVLFRAPTVTPAATPAVLELLTSFPVGPEGARAGDISPQGDRAIIRTWQAALLFPRSSAASWAGAFASAPIELPVAKEPQSEGVTFGADGLSWLSSGEQPDPILYGAPIVYEAAAQCP